MRVAEQDMGRRESGIRFQRQFGTRPRGVELSGNQQQRAGSYLRLFVRRLQVCGTRVLAVGIDVVACRLVGLREFVVRLGPLRSRFDRVAILDDRFVAAVLRDVSIAARDVLARLLFRIA